VFWTGSSILPHLHHFFRPCPRDHHHHGNDPLPVPAESLSITNRLLAVFDRRSETDAAVGALAAAGIDAGEITVLDGDAGLGHLRSRNRPGSPWARTLRLLSFMAVDQALTLPGTRRRWRTAARWWWSTRPTRGDGPPLSRRSDEPAATS
jgi:hypothetical protein